MRSSRIKQLEEVNRQQMHQPNNGRTLLASPQRVQISPLPTSPAAITTSVTAAGSRATNSSGGSSGKSDGRSAARYESAASNHSFNSSAYPARSNSVPSPAAAVAQQQGSPIRATPLSSPRYLQQQQPQHQYYEQHQQHQAQQHSGTPNPDRVHYGAPVPTAAVSGPYGFSSHNSRGVGRQFESPESDEGQPYELEDLPFHSAHTSSTATSAAVTATTFAHVYGTNKATTAPFRAGSAGVGAGGAAVTANSTAVASPHHRESPHPASPFVAQSYVTDYTFPDDAAHSPFVQNNVAEPVYSAYSPGRLNVQEKHAPITLSPPAAAPATEQPAPLTASTSTSVREGSSSQMPAARVYHDFLRSSSEVMDAARRTLHNSRSKENKAAAASVAIRADPNKPTTASTTSVTNTSRSNGSSSYTSSTNNSNTNRVRFAPTPHFNTSEPAFSSQVYKTELYFSFRQYTMYRTIITQLCSKYIYLVGLTECRYMGWQWRYFRYSLSKGTPCQLRLL